MHSHDLAPFAHSHSFADDGQSQRERALALVTALTLATMVIELAVGWWTGSLALTADGWHMGTHALALGGAVLAYRLSQRASRQRGHQADTHSHAHADAHADSHADAHAAVPGGPAGYAFGGWKIEVLAAYTSGLVLMGVALWLVFEGVDTLRHPRPVQYSEALGVAVLGLVVNLASVWLLSRGSASSDGGHEPGEHPDPAQDHGHESAHADGHQHRHERGHERGHQQGHQHAHGHDHNFSAAYLHVLADAFTSVLAIAALAGGAWFGLNWLDPAVALLGAFVIGKWALGVLRHSARALVDATEEPALTQRIRQLIEADGDAKLADLHVWQVGAKAWSAALSVVADAPLPATIYRQRLAVVGELGHVTVEVHRCAGASPR